MSAPNNGPMALLIHGGELADIRELLEEMRVPFVERRQPHAPNQRESRWALVIAGPQRIAEYKVAPDSDKCIRLAVTDSDSKTMLSMMRRMGIELVVRRPVHPSALRLLILHALYQGPEKRRRGRVGVGATLRFRAGLRRYSGILVDLSEGGCRILSPRPIAEGKHITVAVPPISSGDRPLNLRGTVRRCESAPGETPGTQAISMQFDPLRKSKNKQLLRVLAHYRHGPAKIDLNDEELATTETIHAYVEPVSGVGSVDAAVVEAAPAPESVAPDSADPASPQAAERRETPRKPFSNRVIALDQQATRILLGRDISTGGMRVDATEALAVGDQVRLALHVHSHRAPMVVSALVDRDDGEQGLMLQFNGLSSDQEKALAETVGRLPSVEVGGGGSEGAQVVVSEILQHTRCGT